MDSESNGFDNRAAKIWIGIAMGTALGVGIALSRRKRTRWDSAKLLTKRVAARSEDLADVTRDIIDRVKTIYQESRKVVEEAEDLWSRGRKLAGV
ncbi:MAG: hypothetical protein P4L56_15275 [Candidatus Sulfopaludibacter sp.]|nr:hypothetical protein [Candidatus Sulfopaludibacter sp.]